MDSPQTPAPGQNPAAEIVAKSPRELELEATVETERAARVEAERVAAENEDRYQQLVQADSRRPTPVPPVAKPKRFREIPGATFFHEPTLEEISEDED